ncbi:MAG: hypothetical protein A2161_10955 [Candidatus Schekmanbacteria bacterium RBG_13_48_7]|uniref:Transporter n=1 Tax=Candidatus Schekmanbacteria bacterium RBG_13_48_7 TaxID=1817878 RepID=A0A1F7RPX6_9BACT|nr:MAG: hypothetical protein A2161_10955 [Candidatus Schekmanbacteria bacterium RBG_13_48_7]
MNTFEILAPKVADAIEAIEGVVDVNAGIIFAGDAMDIQVDREKASPEGVTPDMITGILEDYLTGVVTTQIQQGPKMVDVRVWIPQIEQVSAKNILELKMQAPDGHLFPLKRIVSQKINIGQAQITRDDLKTMVAVTGRISERDMGSTIRDVMAVLDNLNFLPPGVYYKLGGLYEQQRIAFSGLAKIFVSAVVLVFVLLLYLYESFRVAVAMLFTTLLATATVFVGLWLTGTELNVTAIMGMTMIVGIVTEVAIFYYSEYVELALESDSYQRLINAGKNRMRPIAMTTIAAILALMPLALGFGEVSGMLQPLAIAIISGLTVQLPIVLVVLPVLLVILRCHCREL